MYSTPQSPKRLIPILAQLLLMLAALVWTASCASNPARTTSSEPTSAAAGARTTIQSLLHTRSDSPCSLNISP